MVQKPRVDGTTTLGSFLSAKGVSKLPDRLALDIASRSHGLHIVVDNLRRDAAEVDERSMVFALQRAFIHARCKSSERVTRIA